MALLVSEIFPKERSEWMPTFNNKRLLAYKEYDLSIETRVCTKTGQIIVQGYTGDIKISSKEPIRVGIDQSSSQTGLAVKRMNGELLCLIDIVNKHHIPYNIFKGMLGIKLEQLFQDVEVDMCILEKMWGGGERAYEVLSDLTKFLKNLKYVLPGWSHAEVAEIFPGSWRSSYLAAPEYKGRFKRDKVKVAAVEEGVKRYTQLQAYAEKYGTSDSFDALGIIEGYIDKTFSEDSSMRKISRTMPPTNHKYTFNIALTEEEITTLNLPDRDMVEYEYCEDMTFKENIRRVTSVTNKIAVIKVTDDVAKIQLMWYYGKTISRSAVVYLLGWRDQVSAKLDNY